MHRPAVGATASAERPAIHRIVVPAPHGLRPRNAWLIAGPPVLLVDPGPATDAAYAAVRDAMAERGLSIRDIERVVLTHAHAGHAGLAVRIHVDSGARVAAHTLALRSLVDARAAAAERVDLARRAARAAGMPDVLAAQAADRWRAQLRDALATGPIDLPPSAGEPLADGEPLVRRARGAVDVAAWVASHTAGHSEDHLILVHAAIGRAITGDLIDRHVRALSAVVPTGIGARRASQLAHLMDAWRSLARRGLPVWLPGHGEAIRAPRVLVARRLAEQRLELQAAKRELSSEPLTAWDIARRLDLGSGVSEAGRRLAITIALLDWLVERGHAQRTVSDGAWRFTRTDRRPRAR